MRQCIDSLYDRAVGYAFLCWIFQRPVLVRPVRFSWLLDAFIADSHELELYLTSLGIHYDRRRIGRGDGGNSPATPGRFSEIAEFHRARDMNLK